MKSLVRPELPTASAGSSQAPTAAVDNSAPSVNRPESTYKSGKAVQTNGATSLQMAARKQVLANQVLWARGASLATDAKGYLESYEANLFKPLSATALRCFRSGSGNELVGAGERPAKMRTLHSSSALVVNVFDYWLDRSDMLLAALDLPTGSCAMKFEAQFPTGLEGNPPNLDVAVEWADGTWLGVESKFTEWLTPKAANKEAFRSKYFQGDQALWSVRGHARCQELAGLINSAEKQYRYLDAPQLLKHALGLACSGRTFELLYLYYDVPGNESDAHRAEVSDFASRVAGDFAFHVRRYQDVYKPLAAIAGPQDGPYMEYLAGRYFRDTQTGLLPGDCRSPSAHGQAKT